MGTGFSKEMDTYIELRNSQAPKHRLKQKTVLSYKSVAHRVREFGSRVRAFVKPKHKILEGLAQIDVSQIHVFDREKSVLERVRQRVKRSDAQAPAEPDDVDLELVEKTIAEGKLGK